MAYVPTRYGSGVRELSLSSDIDVENVHLRSWVEFVRPVDDEYTERLHRIRGLLTRIPPLERDVIELHFFSGKFQEQIGEMLGLTQQAVSHRLRRALSRLAFLLEHPELTEADVRRDLRKVWPDAPATMVPLLTEFCRTSSKAATARALNVSIQCVRRHLMQATRHFAAAPGPVAARYAVMLARLLSNQSILCEARRPESHGRKRPHRLLARGLAHVPGGARPDEHAGARGGAVRSAPGRPAKASR